MEYRACLNDTQYAIDPENATMDTRSEIVGGRLAEAYPLVSSNGTCWRIGGCGHRWDKYTFFGEFFSLSFVDTLVTA